MKKVLIFCAGGQEYQEALQIEEAIEQLNKGNDVTFLHCDESIRCCNYNRFFSKKQCRICKFFQKKHRRKYLPEGIKQISIKECLTEEMISISNQKFQYNDVESLKNVTFHGIEIGLSTISSYISFTRNLHPQIDERSRAYFDKILTSQVLMTLALERIYEQEKFDLIIIHNGRFAIYKPFLNFAQNNNINYICTEAFWDKDGKITKNYFYNDIPHNISPYKKKYDLALTDATERDIDWKSIGKDFFERRRNAQGTGDKIYTAGQNNLDFIDDWDETIENIVIFNSSEDEYYAVSGEFEKGKLFSSQLEGIKTIVEHYKDDESKHFYLRVHPNLMNVKYSYHLDLYKLDYPNLTVISADSPISSYALLDKADKVITFGSTMGIEATYAHKPSICLGPTIFDMLNVVYKPKSIEDLWNYIDNKNLKDIYSDKVLIYGYFFMAIYNAIIRDNLKYIEGRRLIYKIFGRNMSVYTYEKILGSNYLYLLFKYILYIISKKPIPRCENMR